MNSNHNQRDKPGDYFPLPKAVFHLGLNAGEISVLAFLMYCEDRKTFQCHPSYTTIGSAIGMSNNTVKKYVDSLERRGFIYTEPTKVTTRDGRVHNGSLLYTLRPIKPIEEAYYERMLCKEQGQMNFQKRLTEYKKKGGKINEAVNL